MSFRLYESTSRDRTRGSVALVACIFIAFVASFIAPFFVRAILYNRTVTSYTEEFRREYEREGVLVEAIALLEERGRGFAARDISSVFAPSYTFTIADGTIRIRTPKSEVLRAWIRWEGDKVVVVAVENEFVRPFSQ